MHEEAYAICWQFHPYCQGEVFLDKVWARHAFVLFRSAAFHLTLLPWPPSFFRQALEQQPLAQRGTQEWTEAGLGGPGALGIKT